VRYNRLGAVPVMAIKIPNGNPFDLSCSRGRRPRQAGISDAGYSKRVERRDGNVAEITETHSAISRGVMSRRAHQAESGLAAQRGTRCLDCRTSRTARVHFNVWIKWRIGIEMFERVGNAFDMLTRMGAQQLRIHRDSGFPPFPVGMSIV